VIKFLPAPKVKSRIEHIVRKLNWDYIDTDKIICFESRGTKSSRVHARCWSLPRVWQQALNIMPHYVVEIIGERYDELDQERRDKLLIHELLHIPKTFSGALRPHKGYISTSIVNKLYKELMSTEELSWIP